VRPAPGLTPVLAQAPAPAPAPAPALTLTLTLTLTFVDCAPSGARLRSLLVPGDCVR